MLVINALDGRLSGESINIALQRASSPVGVLKVNPVRI